MSHSLLQFLPLVVFTMYPSSEVPNFVLIPPSTTTKLSAFFSPNFSTLYTTSPPMEFSMYPNSEVPSLAPQIEDLSTGLGVASGNFPGEHRNIRTTSNY